MAFFSRDIPLFETFRITATAVGSIKTGPGILHSVVINDIETSGALALYDDSGDVASAILASIRVSHTDDDRDVMNFPLGAIYDVPFGTALTYDMSGVGDVTISYL